MAPRLPGGVGARGNAKARFFHPSAPIRAKWSNTYESQRLVDVVIVGKAMHRVNRREQLCYECRIPDIDDGTIFHIVRSNFKVSVAPSTPFPDESIPNTPLPLPFAARAALQEQRALRALRSDVGNVSPNIRFDLSTELQELRQQRVEVDDDNDPAPENAEPSSQSNEDIGEWVTPTTCPRRANSHCTDVKGSWYNFSNTRIQCMDEFSLFRMCFPEKYVKEVIIPATNHGIYGNKLTLSEYYVFLGCHFFMACFEGISDRRDWWSKKPISISDGAPFRLTEYMSYRRFSTITAAMRYTNRPPPSFVDRFHEVREMIDDFNLHYEAEYSPSWLSCLDESMNSWLDKFCPGFMSVPRKPHPLGNEYHSIADGDDGKPVMWRIKLQEGKDRPKDETGRWAYPSEFEGQDTNTGRKFTKTSTLMCEMTKPIHGTGKVVSMDSGFCVASGILHLHDLGVYGQALIKKRKFWPKHCPGEQIERYFDGKELGFTKTLRQEIDGIAFNIHCTRDDKHVTKMMSTHGLLNEVVDHKTYRQVDGEWKSFNYAEYLSRHNRCKHWVDDVNNRRHDPIGLEQVWHTKWWPTRQFTFICSVVESNAVQCRARARKEPATPQLQFRRALALQMMTNKIEDSGNALSSPGSRSKRLRAVLCAEHELCTRPCYTGKWDLAKNTWTKVGTIYAKIKCSGCPTKMRTYCRCNKQLPLCTECYAMHLSECNNTSNTSTN